MFELTSKNQTIKIYNYRVDTLEFIGDSDAYIPANTGLPANCTITPPPKIKAGCVVVYIDGKWQQREDYRGTVVYSKVTGQQRNITDLGLLPDDVTVLQSTGQYDKWDGKKWVKDKDAEQAAQVNNAQMEKKRRISDASQHIQILTDSIAFDGGQPNDAELLKTWTNYRVMLNRVDIATAPAIAWPETPADVA